MGMLNAGLPNGQKLSDLSDKKLAKIFEEIDEDQSNSLSFDEFIHASRGLGDRSRLRVAEIGDEAARGGVLQCGRGGGGFRRRSLLPGERCGKASGRYWLVGRKLGIHRRELRALFDVIDDDGVNSI